MDYANKDGGRKYDLEERTAKFGEKIIIFVRKIKKTTDNIPITSQLIRSGTSIGANYCEASEAESKKDFLHKIGISRKESKETKFWLRMTATAEPQFQEEARELWKEAQEFNLIFGKIKRTCKEDK